MIWCSEKWSSEAASNWPATCKNVAVLSKREEWNIEDNFGDRSEANQDKSELARGPFGGFDSRMSLTVEKEHLKTWKTTIRIWLWQKAMSRFSVLFILNMSRHWMNYRLNWIINAEYSPCEGRLRKNIHYSSRSSLKKWQAYSVSLPPCSQGWGEEILLM